MSAYDVLWRRLWSLVAVVAVAAAVLESSALGVLLTWALLHLMCWVVRQLLPDRLSDWRPSSVAVGILTWWSFTEILPWLGLLVVLVWVLSSPAVVRCARASAHRGEQHVAADMAPGPFVDVPGPDGSEAESSLTLSESMGPLNGLDDQQLCRLWRQSFWVLHQTAEPESMLCVVAVREACLDELERRHAAALHAWLDGGARASSGPEKYLSRPSRRETDLG